MIDAINAQYSQFFFNELLVKMEQAIAIAPEGMLSYRRYPGGASVPYLIEGTGKTRVRKRLDPVADAAAIEALRNKTVACKAIGCVRENLRAAEHAARVRPLDLYAVCRSLGKEFEPAADMFLGRTGGRIVNPAFDCLNERQNPVPFDRSAVRTEFGLFRSKSEALEARMIASTGCEFKYEPAMVIGGKTLFPDFAVNRWWRGDIGIIGHHGLIDRPDYRKKKLEDLEIFMDNGYYPGIHLLILSESRKDGFDAELANKLITAFCSP